MIEKGICDINFTGKTCDTPLMISISHRHDEISLLLIESGANIDEFDEMGMNALALSARIKNCLPVLRKLLEFGADVNSSEEDYGYTALMAASEHGNFEAAEILLERGADVNAITQEENHCRETALILASKKGHVSLVELFLSKGASKEIRNEKGENAYDVAKTAQIRKALK